MKALLVLKMPFVAVSAIFIVLLTFLTYEVGGDNTDPFSDGSNVNGDSSLCRVVRNNKKLVLTSFRNQYQQSNSFCDILDNCANVTCTAEFSRGRLNAGLVLNLCKEESELLYWADIPGQWDQPWNYTFSSKNLDGQTERKEITGSNETKPTRWFIKNTFSITHGRTHISESIKYISVLSVLQICQSASVSEETCTNTTLLDFPRLPKSQICEIPVLSLGDIAEDAYPHRNHEIALLREKSSDTFGSNYYLSSTRSSRNADASAWNPEEFHKQASKRVNKFETEAGLGTVPGDPCNLEDIFGCGQGGSCVANPDGSGTCHCLTGFAFDDKSKICVKKAPSPSVPSDDPSSADSLNSRSYSSAVGAIISIIILVAIAAGIYFGTKYNYIARFRHRIPVLRCWPFRRSQPWEDNVTMVNPLGPPDDDDPPLL